MYKIKTMNKIAKCGTDLFDKNNFVVEETETPDGILVRSASLHEYDYDKNSNLLAIARAGAGVNNIPLPLCSEKGIVVFNTPGANANAVKELVLCGLFLGSRKVSDAINWAASLKGQGDDVPKLVEKGKSNFAGPEISGKTLGVVGLGAIGAMVATAATHLGMTVYGYDPFISVDSAWHMSRSVLKATDIKEIYEKCDYITYHVPLTNDTRESINKDTISLMKDGVRLLNFSRGELANFDDLATALDTGKVASYVTDFPNEKILSMKNVIAIPHLAASTPESEDNCAVMAVQEISEYIMSGNIKNSVNFPAVQSDRSSGSRICVIHKNIPNMLKLISEVPGKFNHNIENMTSKSKGDYAYTIIDLSDFLSDESLSEELYKIDDVIRVRIL